MNNTPRRFLTRFIIACFLAALIPGCTLTAYAGSAKISFSDLSANVGEEFSVSVKITAIEGQLGAADVVLSYDPACIEFVSGNNANGGAGSIRLIGTMDSEATTVFSYNLRFKALQAGDAAINVASYEVYDKDSQVVDVTKVGSSAIKIAAPSTYSSEAALSALKVSPGTLNPAFSPDVTSYTVNVGADVTDILINAPSKDEKANVVVSGNTGLQEGANTVVCKVVAEDRQTVRSYKITVNKAAPGETVAESEAGEGSAESLQAVVGELKVNIDEAEYSVASSFDPALLPEGFTQGTCSYAEKEIMCGAGNNLTLIYLQDAAGNGGFYIYSETSGALSPYVSINVQAKSIVVLPIDDSIEVPEGMVETVIDLNETYKVHGFMQQGETKETVKFCVIYGMNENGDKGLYRYDNVEKTFQRYEADLGLKSQYDDAQVEELLSKYNSLCKEYNLRFVIIVGLIIVCLLLFFMVVNLLLRKRDRDYEESCAEEARGFRQNRRPEHLKENELGIDRDRGRMQPEIRYEAEVRSSDNRSSRSGDARRDPVYARGLDPVAVSRGRTQDPVRRYQEEAAAARERRYVREPIDIRQERPRGYGTDRTGQVSGPGRGDEGFSYNQELLRTAGPERLRERPARQLNQGVDEGLRESVRLREREREERARRARERLERERREDERRSRMEAAMRKSQEEDDDFEFLDLD